MYGSENTSSTCLLPVPAHLKGAASRWSYFPTISFSGSVTILTANRPQALSFGLIADVQYGDYDPMIGRHYRNALAKLSAAVDAFNSRDLAFAVNLGDLIDRDLSSFDAVLPVWRRLRAPGHHVLGNHDFAAPTAEIVRILGMPHAYYHFACRGWRFVVLDTSDISLYAREPGTEKHREAQAVLGALQAKGAANAHVWNGGIGAGQMAWLRDVLRQASAAGERVIILAHAPVFPDNAHNVWNGAQLMQVLESAGNVAAYLCGHNHHGNYGQWGSIHYVTCRGVVETPDSNAYAIVHIQADRIEIEGVGREPSRVLVLGSTSSFPGMGM